MKRILLITPRFPIPTIGACEQDRLLGILQLKRLGYELRVVSKVFDFQDREAINAFSEREGIPVTLIPYRQRTALGIIQRATYYAGRLMNPKSFDGAAYEYNDPAIQQAVTNTLDGWKADLVWCDYTYLWPLYEMVRTRGIPIITRSHNFEPYHFLEEDGYTPLNLLRALPKLVSEYAVIRGSSHIFAITPREERWYRKLGAQSVTTLPLRSLAHMRSQHPQGMHRPLKVFFMGSTYTVPHNRKALRFLQREILPLVRAQAPGSFIFYILGTKVPPNLMQEMPDVVYTGFVENIEIFLSSMDIALIPSLSGAGMQQKVFEPLRKGIPTIASPRAIAGYEFTPGTHFLAARSAPEFARALISLSDQRLRISLGSHAAAQSERLFSGDMLDVIVQDAIKKIGS